MDLLPVEEDRVCAHARYAELEPARSDILERARESAKLTLPYLIPPSGHSKGAKLYRPSQSTGASAVRNLASKLLLTMFPPNAPFFRYSIDDLAMRQELKDDPELKDQIDRALAEIERALMRAVEVSGDRVSIEELFLHLIVGGNGLLYIDHETEAAKLFHLDRYVVVRDGMGRPVEIVVRESFSYKTLPDEARAVLPSCTDGNKDETDYEIYTHVTRCCDEWRVYQEIKGEVIPESLGTYKLDESPWLPLRFIKIDGEDYGRGLVEMYMGDLYSLEGLTKAIVEGTAASSKVLFLVKPNSTTKHTVLSKAPNGAVREGSAEDVTVVQVNKMGDFAQAQNLTEKMERRLEAAFLMTHAIQRSGERVTAEEIRTLAQALEEALGGVYTLLSQEFQLPYVRVREALLRKKRKIPALPAKAVQPAIVTGLEALGRGNDETRLVRYLQTLAVTVGPEFIASRLNGETIATRLAAAMGIDTDGLLKAPEVVADEQVEATGTELANKVAPEVVRQLGNRAQQQAAP